MKKKDLEPASRLFFLGKGEYIKNFERSKEDDYKSKINSVGPKFINIRAAGSWSRMQDCCGPAAQDH